MKYWTKVFIISATRSVILAGVAFPFMLLWNSTVTDVFEIKEIDYWQSVLILILISIPAKVSNLFDSIE